MMSGYAAKTADWLDAVVSKIDLHGKLFQGGASKEIEEHHTNSVNGFFARYFTRVFLSASIISSFLSLSALRFFPCLGTAKVPPGKFHSLIKFDVTA